MNNNDSKILAQFIAGIFGGTVFGFVSLFNYMIEKYDILSWIVLVIIGVILGVVLVKYSTFKNYNRVAIWLGIGTILLPSLFVFFTNFGLLKHLNDISLLSFVFKKGGMLITSVMLTFIAISAIISLLVTGIINWRSIIKRS